MSPEEFFAAKKKTAADLIEENVREISGLLSDGRTAEEVAKYMSAKLGTKITGANLRAKLRRLEAEASKPQEDSVLNRRIKAVKYVEEKKKIVNELLHGDVIEGESRRIPEGGAKQLTAAPASPQVEALQPATPTTKPADPAEKAGDPQVAAAKKKPTIPDFDTGVDADKVAKDWVEKVAKEQAARGVPASFRRSDE